MVSLKLILPVLFMSLSTATAADLTPHTAAAGILTAQDYVAQVKRENKSYAAAEEAIRGAELRFDENRLLTRPSLIGGADTVTDLRETGSVLQGNETYAQNYYLGLRQPTNFGLDARLLYNYNYTRVPGANRNFISQTEFYTAGPVLELTQALGRNGFGQEIRETQQLLLAQAKATFYAERFRQSQLLAQAETTYWRLVVAREAVAANRETVDRAQRLRAWSSQRQKLNLGNRTDFLQTDTAFLARSLELQAAQDEERATARDFNTARGLDTDEVSEKLATFDAKILEDMKIPPSSGFRDDVLAAEQQRIAAEATSRLNIEKNKPLVNLVASMGANGRGAESSEATEKASTDRFPNYSLGLRLDVPLDQGMQGRTREGYRREAIAAERTYERKVFEAQRLWHDLQQRFSETIARYRLATKIENAQREKMEYERNRHGRGLTTTFQVLQFEQDFANAQLARIRTQVEVVNTYAQIKTFGGSP